MQILIAAGAFKQSLTAAQACRAIAAGLGASGLDARWHCLPIADGGNGTLDALLASGGERRRLAVRGPLGRMVEAEYGLIEGGRCAVIEMALASGLELLQPHELDPLGASSYGTGQLLVDALERGVERVIIGMGGSATVDGGMGCLEALGLRLLDVRGAPIPPGGGGLADIAVIDAGGIDARWRDIELLIASDVDNPVLGERGAARVFGPQKGADAAMVEALERNLAHCFAAIFEQQGVDLRMVPGAGAAGALAGGLMAFLPCKLQSGIDIVLGHSAFHTHLARTDLLITGEGRIDAQTLSGKGPLGVARLAAQAGIPTVALVGGLGIDDAWLRAAGIDAAFAIVDQPMPLEQALAQAEELLQRAARRLGYILRLARERRR